MPAANCAQPQSYSGWEEVKAWRRCLGHPLAPSPGVTPHTRSDRAPLPQGAASVRGEGGRPRRGTPLRASPGLLRAQPGAAARPPPARSQPGAGSRAARSSSSSSSPPSAPRSLPPNPAHLGKAPRRSSCSPSPPRSAARRHFPRCPHLNRNRPPPAARRGARWEL